ncbi:MAG: YegP family protein [Cyclobacteriaceae bacterium]
MGKFTIYTGNDDQFRFNLKAGNGEKVLQSEGYTSKAGCQNGIASVQKNAAEENRFEQRESSNGKHYFVLKAGNGEIIGTSEMYESQQACQNGIASVQRNATDASIVEE